MCVCHLSSFFFISHHNWDYARLISYIKEFTLFTFSLSIFIRFDSSTWIHSERASMTNSSRIWYTLNLNAICLPFYFLFNWNECAQIFRAENFTTKSNILNSYRNFGMEKYAGIQMHAKCLKISLENAILTEKKLKKPFNCIFSLNKWQFSMELFRMR